MAGSPPRSPRCLWGLAVTYPDDSDPDELRSGGVSSDRADSDAADDAFEAAVESQFQVAADAANAFVRGRLVECGIVGAAATFLMTTSIADLRAVAVAVRLSGRAAQSSAASTTVASFDQLPSLPPYGQSPATLTPGICVRGFTCSPPWYSCDANPWFYPPPVPRVVVGE